jgi:thioredoxin reductase (NADPH)
MSDTSSNPPAPFNATIDVLIVGDGPGGLSAALFLAKNGLRTVVVGRDETAMHWAMLYNYLGVPDITGSDFQKVARAQAERHGATLVAARVDGIDGEAGAFAATLDDGGRIQARYVILSEGKAPVLAGRLGLALDGDRIAVNHEGLSSVANVYAVGRMVRPGRSQAIISAGDGAAAAIDILAREKGKDRFADWDSPPQA